MSSVLLLASGSWAQKNSDSPHPSPTIQLDQLVSAKKVFLARGIAEYPLYGYAYKGGPARSYDRFSEAMTAWGKYELVSTPGDSDLVFEINLVMSVSSNAKTDPENEATLLLKIMDPKTKGLLWMLDQPIAPEKGNRWKQRLDQGMNHALAQMVEELKKLATRPSTVAGGAAK